jgi:hypothetical protein
MPARKSASIIELMDRLGIIKHDQRSRRRDGGESVRVDDSLMGNKRAALPAGEYAVPRQGGWFSDSS